MKNTVLASLALLVFTATSCIKDDSVEPEVIIDWPQPILISRDSIVTGDYLGLGVNSEAAKTYSAVQTLTQKGVFYLNVVGNISSDLSQLNGRIPLYKYIILDEKKGTDSGIQITLESGAVKSIYLNSGEQLSQWPKKEKAASSIRLGDKAGELYEKLQRIQGNRSYANKFEYIALLTKELSAGYDPVMGKSPQWYFRYQPEPDIHEEIKINFENGKVKYLEVSRFKDV
jgi:hypothetical protein